MTENNEQLVSALRASVRENERLKQAEREPIAIVSTSCRCPGGVTSPEELWNLVSREEDAVGPLPTDRGWDLERLYHPDPEHEGTSYVNSGGFLKDAGGFDPDFFGIAPREAEAMDPQQRLLLETSWEVFERAGILPRSLKGTPTGVFLGAAWQGYGEGWRELEGSVQGHLVTGMSTSVISGRIAYTLGLEGPAITLDTGCSSSFVALHLAIQSLRRKETSLAVVGGVAVMSAPISLIGFSRHKALAKDGRCKAFSADADGMGLGEGAGTILLERLSDARRNGHPVLAVVSGSAINQDGASNGMAAPNGLAQQRVIRQALAGARLDPGDVDVVEAHGTGTGLGDPIEAEALIATYGRDRDSARPLHIGSLKSNIGHPQAAAGVLSVIKMVEALRHGVLPRSLHLDELTSKVDWSEGSITPLVRSLPWPETERERTVGISSFGVSGTNAHVILREAPKAEEVREPVGPETVASSALPWVLSGRTENALRDQAVRLRDRLRDEPDQDPLDVAYTLATARTAFEHRAAVVAKGKDDLLKGLEAIAQGDPSDLVRRGRAGQRRKRRVVFMFPGQGSQWSGMARRMLDESPVFAGRIAECERAFSDHVDWSLEELLRTEDEGWMERVDQVQPVLFAVMVSLAAVWRSLGVEPDAVVGHSQGEIAAACVSGALSLEDAARVVILRSRSLTRIAGSGGMLSVGLPAETVSTELDRYPGLAVAAANGASSAVVSGPDEELNRLEQELGAEGVRTRRVPVDYASHSAAVELLREELATALAPVRHRDSSVPFYSTVLGAPLELSAEDTDYWYRNLRRTVELESTTRRLARDGHDVFVEMSPHPVLTPAVTETLDDEGRLDASVVSDSLRREQGGLDRLMNSLCGLHTQGVRVDWEALLSGGRVVDLPTYSFQRRHYWLEAPVRGLGIGSETSSWRYGVAWKRTELTASPELAGRWLIAVPAGSGDSPLVTDVLGALDGHGARCELLELVPGEDRAAIAERLRSVEAPVGLLSLCALGGDAVSSSGRSLGLTLNNALVQACNDIGGDVPLWAATSGAVAAHPGETVSEPEQATTWGLGRIAATEHPQFWRGLIDLPEGLDDSAAENLVALLASGSQEPQAAVRGAGVYVRRLVRAPDVARSWRPEGVVLVTGGTGALGGRVAEWLADNGAEHLVLLSRGGPAAPGADRLREELTAKGARVSIVAVDVSDRDALSAALDGLPDLNAIVHTAGALDDGLIDGLTPERYDTVLRPKIAAARNLHELTREHDLSAFILFSSLAGTLGGPGQGSYAAANAYLDGLARHRRDQGLAATSIAWGAWDSGGLVDEETSERLRRGGIPAMPAEKAVDAMAKAVGSGDVCVAVADIEWRLLLDSSPWTKDLPVLSELPEVRERDRAVADERADEEDDRWLGLRGDERERELRRLVTAEVAAALGHDPADLETDRAFRDLGFDSLTAVDLRNRMASATGVGLPVTLVFDYPTVDDLVRHLSEELPGGAEEDAPEPQGQAPVTAEDPIAIVAVGCRMPGGVNTPEQLWDLLKEGRDVVGDFPRDRGWDVDGLYDPDPDNPGTYYVQGGGFLQDAGDFDAGFFGISPREALTIDPQQRLLLETSWEVFERAGINPRDLKGSRTGVYVGASYNDYGSRAAGSMEHEGYLALGSASSVVSGRVSYVFGFEGPAITVDTACSSSLVALHLATQALRKGECSMALVSGSMVMSTPVAFTDFSRQGGLARDGRCKAFSTEADGTGWGEGVGTLVVEPLSRARERGHRVLGLVRGSAVNQDGASSGLTAPNGPSQQRVVRAALRDAGLSADDVDMVEAHGTGTALGDPIEAEALLKVYGRERERPLWLGSLKSNIGHTQAASGIAGVIKTTLALQNRVMPRTLHAESPSELIDWSPGGLTLLNEQVEWPVGDRPRRAGVSSFGVSGTNAHVLLEEAPVVEVPVVEASVSGASGVSVVPWVLSGRGVEGLRGQAGRLAGFVSGGSGVDVEGVGAGLSGRVGFEDRAVVLGSGVEGFAGELRSLAEGSGVGRGVVGRVGRGGVGFVFAGQGSQRLGMGRELYERFGVFREVFDEVMGELEGCLGSGVREVVWGGDEGLLGRTVFAQAGLFAVEVALFRLLESWGVEADCVMGHSVGELAAAHVAGVWSLADAARVVVARGRLMDALPAGGVMVAVSAAEDRVVAVAAECGGGVDVAAVNGPESVVVSGAEAAVERVVGVLAGQGCRVRRLRVSHAFHSALMEPMLAEFREVLEGVSFGVPRCSVVSNVSGRVVVGEELSSPEYWVRHVRGTVRFADGVRSMVREGVSRFVEVGPDAGLVSVVGECVAAEGVAVDDVVLVGALRRGRGEEESVVGAAADLWVHGVDVDWGGFFASVGVERVPVGLPTYAFQRERFWLDSGGGGLLSDVVELAEGGVSVWSGRVSLSSHGWLADHAVGGQVLLPGTAFLDLALHAALRSGLSGVAELTLQQPLVLPPRGEVELQVVVDRGVADGPRVAVYSRLVGDEGAGWSAHAVGVLGVVGGVGGGVSVPEGAEVLPVDGLYERLSEGGFGYGPAFRGLRRAWRGVSEGEVIAEVALPRGWRDRAGDHVVHPALLDAVLHVLSFVDLPGLRSGLLPFSWSGVRVFASGAASVLARVVLVGGGAVSVELVDGSGGVVLSVDELVLRPAGGLVSGGGPLYGLSWTRTEPTTTEPSDGPAGATVRLDPGAGADALGALSAPIPSTVVVPLRTWEGDLTEAPAAARAATASALELLRTWIADERYADSRLVFAVTVPTIEAVDDDIVTAAVRGLVRAAQNEHPGRFGLVFTDDPATMSPALDLLDRETELLVWEGEPRARRLTRSVESDSSETPALDGTVLVTGATGTLGGLVARHLVERHGVRGLVLAGRRGAEAPGMAELADELGAEGVQVRVVSCDVTDAHSVAAALEEVPAELPLKAVVHAAGLLDDGVVSGLDPDRIAHVLAPKLDGAVTLWHQVKDLKPSAFVLFSSVSGTLGGAGQGAYSAANSALDALASRLRSEGAPATSVAWGVWGEDSEMTAKLSDADRKRVSRSGIEVLRTDEALELFDSSLASGAAFVAAAKFASRQLRDAESDGFLLPILRDLVPRSSRALPVAAAAEEEPGSGTAPLPERLAAMADEQRRELLRGLVGQTAATVLGYSGADAVDPDRGLLDIGFDSLTAVELRNRLGKATGLRLPVTLLFDYPTVLGIADHLYEELMPDPDAALRDRLDSLERQIREIAEDESARERLRTRLRAVLDVEPENDEESGVASRIESASDDEMFAFIDQELGVEDE